MLISDRRSNLDGSDLKVHPLLNRMLDAKACLMQEKKKINILLICRSSEKFQVGIFSSLTAGAA